MRRPPQAQRLLAAILAAGMAVGMAVIGVASAHEDLRIVDESIELAPGASASFPTAIHYHRIVGRYEAIDGASEVSLTLVVTDSEMQDSASGDSAGDTAADTAGDTARHVVLADDLSGSGTLNELIRCCDGRVWSEAELIVRNHGTRPATLDLRAWAMHDDFAVVVDRAESGAVATPLLLFLGLGVAAGTVAWRDRRRSDPRVRVSPFPPSLRWSAGLFVGALLIAGTLALAGMVRYGAGPVDGMVAILADVPVPGGPFGARDAMVMSVLMLAWMASIGFWIRSLYLGAQHVSRWPLRLGLALGLISLVGGVAMGWTYGSFGAPVLLGVVLAVPLVAVSLSFARSSPAIDTTGRRPVPFGGDAPR